jgi:hypothetical protein
VGGNSVQLKEVARAIKFDVEPGKWSAGHISRQTFPFSRVRSKRYRLGMEWKWRVVSFNTHGREFKVLIELNENKQIYRATLAWVENDDLAVLCQHEYHAFEPG